MTRVEVVWRDAWAKLDYISVEDARKLTATVTHAVGWLVCQDDDKLVIATDRCTDEQGAVRNYHVIPREMVVEVVELTPLEKSDYTETVLGV